MTKSELLSILYSERDRVEKQYSRPGWTIWAIAAAVASLGWMVWDMAGGIKNWEYVALVFFMLYYLTPIADSLLSRLRKKYGKILWGKGDLKAQVHSVVNLLLCSGMLVVIVLLIPQTFYPVLYWISFATAIFMIFVHAFICYHRFIYFQRSSRGENWGIFLIAFIPSIVLIALYLRELGYDNAAFKIGVLIYGIWILLMLLPIGEWKKFVQIDELISRVLYDTEEVDEKAVLESLEIYTLGFRLGRHITESRLRDFKLTVASLMDCSVRLINCLEKENGKGMDAILEEGMIRYKGIAYQYLDMRKELEMAYGKDLQSADKYLTPIKKNWLIAVKTLDLWARIVALKEDKSAGLSDKITIACQETLGAPQISKLVVEELSEEEMKKCEEYRKAELKRQGKLK